MEQNFQTSFIPKKPIVEERSSPSRPASFLTIASVFIFFTMVLAAGGLYFYKGILAKDITTMSDTLEKAKNRFEPKKIAILQVLDKRLIASTEILSKHIATSPIFQVLQQITSKNIRYTKFSYSAADEKNTSIAVRMSGQALSYKDVALQADLFSKNKELIDPVFSNLSLDEKGNVLFDLDFSVDSKLVGYKQALETKNGDSSSPSDINTETLN